MSLDESPHARGGSDERSEERGLPRRTTQTLSYATAPLQTAKSPRSATSVGFSSLNVYPCDASGAARGVGFGAKV